MQGGRELAPTAASDAATTRRLADLFTWRRAIFGGVLAFAHARHGDVGLYGDARDRLRDAREALRIDLEQSTAFSLVDPSTVNATLALMLHDASEPVTEEVAREVAVRQGAEAVVSGEVRPPRLAPRVPAPHLGRP